MMVVDNNSIISYREIGIYNKRESKRDGNKNFENIVYRDKRGRLYSKINIKSY